MKTDEKKNAFGADMVVTRVLSNGMKLVVVPTKARPRVLVQMLYDVGSASEEPSEKGLAHLLEHMIFKGTPTLQEGAIAKLAARYGANFNAFTWYDLTSYFFEVDSNNWKPFIPMLADCMENVLLNEQHLASEVKAVIQELRMRNDNPMITLGETLFSNMFDEQHPYFTPVIGYKKDLAGMTADRLRAFYKKYYTPDSATLFVVGDVVVEDVVAEVERYFDHIPASDRKKEQAVFDETKKTLGFHKILAKHWIRPQTLLAWTIPSGFGEGSDIAKIVSKILGEGQQSILYKRLIDKDQSADAVNAGVMSWLHESIFMISCTPRDGRADDCVNAINEELSKIAQTHVEAKVLARLVKKEHLFYENIKENPTKALLNPDILLSYLKTGALDAAFNFVDRLRLVTPPRVSQFVSDFLKTDLMMRIDSVPQTQEQREIWRQEQAKEQDLEREILAVHVRTEPLPTDVIVPSSEQYPDSKPIAVKFVASSLKTTLPNGLQVILYEQQDTDLCGFRMGYLRSIEQNGSIDSYLNWILLKLFAEGADGQTKQELMDWFEDRGLQLVSLEAGAFICLKADLTDVVKKYFKIIFNPDFLKQGGLIRKIFSSDRSSQMAFEKVKQQIIQMLKSFYDSPQLLGMSAETSQRYPGTPYGCTVEDILSAVHKLNFSDLPALYKKVFNPSDWVLSIAGNIDSQALLEVITKATASWKGSSVQALQEDGPAALPIPAIDVPMDRDQVYLTYVRESKIAASEISVDRVAIDLLSTIYMGGMSSRLFKLRDATGIFYTCGGALASPTLPWLNKTQDSVFALVSPEKLEEACVLFESFLKNVFSSPISQEEFNDARHTMRSRMSDSTTGAFNIVNYLSGLVIYKRDEDFRKRYVAVMDSLTPQILEEVANRYAKMNEFTRVRVGNIPKAS